MFRIDEKSIAYIVLFASPSPLNTPYNEFDKMTRMEPKAKNTPYSIAKSIVPPAPIARRMSFRNISNRIVVMMEMITVIKIVWMAPLSALSLFFSPIYLDKAEAEPAPNPFPIPISAMKIGLTNPTPANASAPKPDTQIASITL